MPSGAEAGGPRVFLSELFAETQALIASELGLNF